MNLWNACFAKEADFWSQNDYPCDRYHPYKNFEDWIECEDLSWCTHIDIVFMSSEGLVIAIYLKVVVHLGAVQEQRCAH